MKQVAAILLCVLLVSSARGDIVISEWMYNGAATDAVGEYIEFTNAGETAVDMTGWSYDDSSRIAGTVDLSAFGVVAPGESVILTDATAADFAANWGLTDVKIIGGLTANLGRNDEINLYDASQTLVDRLTYGDEDFPGTVRTQLVSCNIPATDYGCTEAQTSWVAATVGDAYGSKLSVLGEIGSPGRIVGAGITSDIDEDGDTDLADYDLLECCLLGPEVAYDPIADTCGLTPDTEGYLRADLDRDGDVDLADVAYFAEYFTGASGPVVTQIVLNGDSITVNGAGVTVDGTTATITQQGTFNVTGTLNDGQLAVTAAGGTVVTLVLDGVNISNSTSACINITSAGETDIVLATGTQNYLYDAATYVFEDPNVDEPTGALFSKDRLIMSGDGTLTVHGNYNDAIVSKDELVITSGTFNVFAVDDGIRGKDYLQIDGGTLNVTAGGDALKSDEDEDAELGYIAISGGTLDIASGGDGLAAETDVHITGGDFTFVCGGGHTTPLPTDLSAKAIKGLVSVLVENGTFNIDSADDAVHSNDTITIEGGTFTIATGDDGMHADTELTVNGGTINITASYEGLESMDLTINDGNIHIVSSDDGINAAGGDGSGGTGWPPEPPSGDNYLAINGGYIVVNASCDGIDVNGSITMTGGTVLVHGPTADFNGALDYDQTFVISGGFLVAAGSAGMAQAPSTTSTQRSVKITYSSTKAAGTLMHLQTTSGGTDLLTFAPLKAYRSVVFSAPTLTAGLNCQLYRSGSSTGTYADGLYTGGTYTPGTLTNTFSTTNIVTNVSAQ